MLWPSVLGRVLDVNSDLETFYILVFEELQQQVVPLSLHETLDSGIRAGEQIHAEARSGRATVVFFFF